METFTKLFGSLLVFVYHCFDRIVINGYLSGSSRPEQVVYFFRDVVGVSVSHRKDRPVATHRSLPELGGSLRQQSQASHRVGRKGRAQRRLRTAPSAPDGEEQGLRRASISSSKAWSKGPRSASASPSFRQKIPTIACWLISVAATRTTTLCPG
jgi:hypothetical protein